MLFSCYCISNVILLLPCVSNVVLSLTANVHICCRHLPLETSFWQVTYLPISMALVWTIATLPLGVTVLCCITLFLIRTRKFLLHIYIHVYIYILIPALFSVSSSVSTCIFLFVMHISANACITCVWVLLVRVVYFWFFCMYMHVFIWSTYAYFC
jgi:hypothetical protein